jgi:hypothetical protein
MYIIENQSLFVYVMLVPPLRQVSAPLLCEIECLIMRVCVHTCLMRLDSMSFSDRRHETSCEKMGRGTCPYGSFWQDLEGKWKNGVEVLG